MTKKRKTNKCAPKKISAAKKSDENRAQLIAQTFLSPTVQAAGTLNEYGKSYNLDMLTLIKSLTDQVNAVVDRDNTRCEAMLTVQAHTLDAIFNTLARQAINADYLNKMESFLKLGLRAQSQCRATLETLTTIQNPPMVGYVRQANIAHGHQQVNNATSTEGETSHARKNPNLQNKLLEEKDGERLDTGTTGTAGRTDPAMATLGKVDGTKDTGR